MMMKTLDLSPDQKSAIEAVVAAIDAKKQCVTLGGYAGTGKTTVTGEIVKILRARFPRIAFCCFTGKAYKVLEQKLLACEALLDDDYCGTIHKLVYDPMLRRKEEILEDGTVIKENHYDFKDKDSQEKYDLIVVDEASMVTEPLYNKLLEFGVPILAIGDHGQLPPLPRESFNLMANPDVRLTKIHRQAENDPIVRLSIMAREDGEIPFGTFGPNCIKTNNEALVNDIKNPLDWAIIVATHRKRVERNRWARYQLGFEGLWPIVGDRVVCLKNIYSHEVFNGMTGFVTSVAPSKFLAHEYQHPHWFAMGVRMDSEINYLSDCVFKYQFMSEKPLKETVTHPKEAREVDPDDFGHLWDFGYALTVWKSQGSEWNSVVFYEERAAKRWLGDDWPRFLYTGITRAKRELIIVGE